MLNEEDLIHIARETMPFGKYKDRLIIDLPEEYLLWFKHKGWPSGRLGEWLQLTLEIKINGLESLVTPLKEKKSAPTEKAKRVIRFD